MAWAQCRTLHHQTSQICACAHSVQDARRRRHGSDPEANKKKCVRSRSSASQFVHPIPRRPACRPRRLPVRARSGNPCRASRRGSVGGEGCLSPPCMCRANWDPCPRAPWVVGRAAPLQRTTTAREVEWDGDRTRPVGVGTLGPARSGSELLVVHATERTASHKAQTKRQRNSTLPSSREQVDQWQCRS
jgi:hypothetical protein